MKALCEYNRLPWKNSSTSRKTLLVGLNFKRWFLSSGESLALATESVSSANSDGMETRPVCGYRVALKVDLPRFYPSWYHPLGALSAGEFY